MRGHIPLAGLLLIASAAGAQTPAACLACEAPIAVQRTAHYSPVFPAAGSTAVIPRRVRGAVFGAVWGTLAGALIGGIVGTQTEECPGDGVCAGGLGGALAGALIGAVLGGVLGAVLTDPDPSAQAP